MTALTTTGWRGLAAVLAGAAAGGLGVVLLPLAIMLGDGLISGRFSVLDLLQLCEVWVLTSIVWLVGLTVAGLPAWIVLHRRGRRGWRAAVALGAGLTFTVFMLLSFGDDLIREPPPTGSTFSAGDAFGQIVVDNQTTAYGYFTKVLVSAIFALIGAVVGWVVWRVAYRSDPVAAS